MKKEEVKNGLISGGVVALVATAAVAGSIIAGPVGAIIGASIPTIIDRMADDLRESRISKNEKRRAADLRQSMKLKWEENLKAGKKLRDDGFFDKDDGTRSSFEEVLEGVFLAAINDHEERKIRCYGNFQVNSLFCRDIDRNQLNHLNRAIKKLSWAGVLLLKIAADQSVKSSFKDKNYGDFIEPNDAMYLAVQAQEMYNDGLVNFNNDASVDYTHVNFSKLGLTSLGKMVYELMESDKIPEEEVKYIIDKINDDQIDGAGMQGTVIDGGVF